MPCRQAKLPQWPALDRDQARYEVRAALHVRYDHQCVIAYRRRSFTTTAQERTTTKWETLREHSVSAPIHIVTTFHRYLSY